MDFTEAIMIMVNTLSVFSALVAIVYFTVVYRNKAKKMDHEERMLAIEKGVAMPEMPVKKKAKPHNPLMAPLILMGIGMGYFAFWIFDTGWSSLGGYVVFFMGVGMLVAFLLNNKMEGKKKNEATSLSDSDLDTF